MALYNRNKKSANQTKINKSLTLAQVIEEAGQRPEYRAEFYRRFLKDDLFVLVDKNTDVARPLSETPIMVLPNNVIPVFTHPERIFDANAIPQDTVAYIKVKGRNFLEMVVGESVIVNPFSKVYKELIPMEITEMLNGSIFNISQNNKIQTQMEVLIGHPKVYPDNLVEELKELYGQDPDVDAAYVGWTFNKAIDVQPHYIIALESRAKNFESTAKRTAEIARKHLKEKELIDIIQLEEKGNFSEFFYKESTPFYTAKKE